jgi:hypothetical protein
VKLKPLHANDGCIIDRMVNGFQLVAVHCLSAREFVAEAFRPRFSWRGTQHQIIDQVNRATISVLERIVQIASRLDLVASCGPAALVRLDVS